jgi:hypothetical protein
MILHLLWSVIKISFEIRSLKQKRVDVLRAMDRCISTPIVDNLLIQSITLLQEIDMKEVEKNFLIRNLKIILRFRNI